MHRFFLENSLAEAPSQVHLSEEESHHACRVLRLGRKDTLILVDGMGHFADASILEDHPKRTLCRILEVQEGLDKKPEIHLAVAPPKNISRFEWLLEKATEIGLGSITPLHTTHSERQHLKPDRLKKVLISAMKQSQRSWLPQLHPLTPFSAFIETNLPSLRYLAYLNNDSHPLSMVHKTSAPACVLIGPEGDFSLEEYLDAIRAGFQAVSLGEARLRTETAALYACTALNLINESLINEK